MCSDITMVMRDSAIVIEAYHQPTHPQTPLYHNRTNWIAKQRMHPHDRGLYSHILAFLYHLASTTPGFQLLNYKDAIIPAAQTPLSTPYSLLHDP
jgi:hypothetical protein